MSSESPDCQVIITGSSAGIGLATAQRFVAQGARVFGVSRRLCPLAAVRSVQVDLLTPGWPQQLDDALAGELVPGRRTVVVHNAALLDSDSIDTASAEQLRRTLELNVVVPMQLSQWALPLCGPGSAFVFVGSTLSEKAVANTLSYVTSKHAALGLMRATTQDLIGRAIHSVAVCPGFTDTEMLRERIPDKAVLQQLGAANGFGRLIDADEIAATIEFCAAHPVLNGSVIHANLGQIER
ncbi:MAG: SDR family oxidoreductase [Pseudomonadota bacterium]